MNHPSQEQITAGGRTIGANSPVFVIAEAGINHNGDLKLAERLILEAKKNGADAVKFQTYITEKRVAKDSPIFGILKQCELSYSAQEKLFRLAREEGILFFSTPFDEESADFLAGLGTVLIKIASFDIVNLKLLRHVASKKIPLIVSRGMTNETEVDAAVSLFKREATAFALLHCISSYPNREEDANLRVIGTLKERYGCVVGYSDHTLGIRVPVLSVAAGAAVIEKHFTLDRAMEGPDHGISCDPAMLGEMVREIRRTETILGAGDIKTYEAEKPILVYRRVTR
ncbi:MAG: N-acetylneuraminate synthase family protein [Candidatus Omnitrophica bacterium]|nr:N-acetylneuraminate synthase family protein [Candidatus Omnitrophota bacterium]